MSRGSRRCLHGVHRPTDGSQIVPERFVRGRVRETTAGLSVAAFFVAVPFAFGTPAFACAAAAFARATAAFAGFNGRGGAPDDTPSGAAFARTTFSPGGNSIDPT